MSTFKPLKILASRRQVLKAGLAAMTLSGVASQVSAKEQPLKTSNGHSKPAAKKAGGRRIVMLDPGHGGIDTGAIGHNGSKEKHVVLAIAKNVRSILRSNGIDARLTRTGDTFIPAVRPRGDRPSARRRSVYVNPRRWLHQPERRRRLGVRPVKPRRQ